VLPMSGSPQRTPPRSWGFVVLADIELFVPLIRLNLDKA